MSIIQSKFSKEQTLVFLQNLLQTLYDENCFEIHNKIVLKHKQMIALYHDCDNHVLFHVLTGSTPPTKCSKWDFEGKHCICDFIIREYNARLPQITANSLKPTPVDEKQTICSLS